MWSAGLHNAQSAPSCTLHHQAFGFQIIPRPGVAAVSTCRLFSEGCGSPKVGTAVGGWGASLLPAIRPTWRLHTHFSGQSPAQVGWEVVSCLTASERHRRGVRCCGCFLPIVSGSCLQASWTARGRELSMEPKSHMPVCVCCRWCFAWVSGEGYVMGGNVFLRLIDPSTTDSEWRHLCPNSHNSNHLKERL